MARDVAQDRYGVAYSGLAFIDAGVRMLPIAESANGLFHASTYENVALANYP
jgi:phosphate transport system substrate-binding protein